MDLDVFCVVGGGPILGSFFLWLVEEDKNDRDLYYSLRHRSGLSVFIRQAIYFPFHAPYYMGFGVYINTLQSTTLLFFFKYIHGALTYVEINPKIKAIVWESPKANVC